VVFSGRILKLDSPVEFMLRWDSHMGFSVRILRWDSRVEFSYGIIRWDSQVGSFGGILR
jgi:hypothetical protein